MTYAAYKFWPPEDAAFRLRNGLYVEVSVVSFSSSLVFFENSVQNMCTSAPYRITMKTRILGAQVAQIYLDFF